MVTGSTVGCKMEIGVDSEMVLQSEEVAAMVRLN
jgi:hypothetical protein